MNKNDPHFNFPKHLLPDLPRNEGRSVPVLDVREQGHYLSYMPTQTATASAYYAPALMDHCDEMDRVKQRRRRLGILGL